MFRSYLSCIPIMFTSYCLPKREEKKVQYVLNCTIFVSRTPLQTRIQTAYTIFLRAFNNAAILQVIITNYAGGSNVKEMYASCICVNTFSHDKTFSFHCAFSILKMQCEGAFHQYFFYFKQNRGSIKAQHLLGGVFFLSF